MRRVYVEHAIGAFKRRFRLLRLGFQSTAVNAKKTIMSAAIIHNYITKIELRRTIVPDRRPVDALPFYDQEYDWQRVFSGYNLDPAILKVEIASKMYLSYYKSVILPRTRLLQQADDDDAAEAARVIRARRELEADPPDQNIFGQYMQRHYDAMYRGGDVNIDVAVDVIARHDEPEESLHGISSAVDSQHVANHHDEANMRQRRRVPTYDVAPDDISSRRSGSEDDGLPSKRQRTAPDDVRPAVRNNRRYGLRTTVRPPAQFEPQ